MQRTLVAQAGALAPYARSDLQAEQLVAIANSDGAERLIAYALTADWTIDAEQTTCPVRIVWGTSDPLLPWPSSAARYKTEWLPHADWVELDGVGHYPQLDAPIETAQLILGVTASGRRRPSPETESID